MEAVPLRDSAESDDAAAAAATGARHGDRAAATAAVATAPPLRVAFEPARADPVPRRGGVGRMVGGGRGDAGRKSLWLDFLPLRRFETRGQEKKE